MTALQDWRDLIESAVALGEVHGNLYEVTPPEEVDRLIEACLKLEEKHLPACECEG